MEPLVAVENSPFIGPLQLGLVFCALALLTHTTVRFFAGRRRNPLCLPLPPGPKGYPLIGSLFDLPTSQQWLTYAQWAKLYGDVFSFEVLGQRFIVLDSLEAAQELFERRSANYSDRPRMPMLLELMNFSHLFGLLPYGPLWRRHRRTFNDHFQASAVWKYQPIQARETRALLNRLLQSPEGLTLHLGETLVSTIMSIVYGLKIHGFDDPYIIDIEESARGFNMAGIPGSFLVDLIPALKHVPSWFPGAGFQKTAEYWAKINQKVIEVPFNHVAQQMKEGTAGSSIAATLITALPEGDAKLLAEETQIAQNVSAVAYAGGSDATLSAIQSFFLAMAKYPEAQKRAQAELDTVIGPHRLPEFSDSPSLPYVNAVIKETLRWQSASPLAIGHMATEDDVYGGYFIPKGSIVVGNVWAILHDEKVFTDPEEYRPDRYLKDGQLDPACVNQKKCPGRFLSGNTLFSIASSTLHVFDITPALDEKGLPVPLSDKMTSGVTSYPEPFKVEIKPRSPSAEVLVRDAVVGDA